MPNKKMTDATQFLADLEGGVFAAKIGAAITEAAMGTINWDRASQVVITLGLKRMGNSRQVMVDHKLLFVQPRQHGKITEEETTNTPMYVNADGTVTAFAESVLTNQNEMFHKATIRDEEA